MSVNHLQTTSPDKPFPQISCSATTASTPMTGIRSTHQYRDGHQDKLEPVRPIDLQSIDSFSDLLTAYRCASFGARRVGDALAVMEAMAKDDECFVVCTLSGAMTVAKMGLVVCEMIERGYVNLIISTGALQAHGMIEGSGMAHFKYQPEMDDAELFRRGYDRVYDTLELEKNLDELEILVRRVLETIDQEEPIGSHQLFRRLGEFLHQEFQGERGILKSAFEHRVPVIVPALTDSELGLDIAVNNKLRRKENRNLIAFDPFLDLEFYTDIIKAQKRIGIFTIGGGVPRNWAQQVAPYLEISQLRAGEPRTEAKRFLYGVRICPESEHWGGLSGCTYSEGTSWGKFVPPQEGGRFAEVLSDATIVWPLLIRALMERVPRKPSLNTSLFGDPSV